MSSLVSTPSIPLKFFSAWFCPYAQRAWIALELYKIPYELIEALSLQESDYNSPYEKNEELLRLNPKGLVPTLKIPKTDLDRKNVEDFLVVIESMDCVEYINQHLANTTIATTDGTKETVSTTNPKSFIPDESYMEDAKRWNREICSVFYKVLMKQTAREQSEAFEMFTNSLTEFVQCIQDNGGYYKQCAKDGPNIVDITVVPWLLRLHVLEYYRSHLSVSESMGKNYHERLMQYRDRMTNLPAVQTTIAKDGEKLIRVYKRYADGTAKSKVADAVRAGKNAHEI